jgi:glyoxylase-like metal-dependent hydrolase (beta-lactamase superfamily II)
MLFHQFFDAETSTYTYVLGDEASLEAILIDPVKEGLDEYLSYLKNNNLKLKLSLDTHVHADHITASGFLREKTGCETGLHESSKAACASLKLKDGQQLRFGQQTVKVLHTPGHTPCHASFLIGDRVFTGDALLINGCGRTDFQSGSATQLWDSVQNQLFTLPPDTLVYPGHDYKKMRVSCIQQEKDLNPRFLRQTKDSFSELMANLKLADPKKIHEAVPANEACGLK